MLRRIYFRPNSHAVSVLLVVVATVLTQWPHTVLADSQPLLLVAAVVLSGWYGGLKPGLLAAVLATLSVDFCFMLPRYSLTIASLDQGVQLSIFLLVALVGCLPAAQLEQVKRKVRAICKLQDDRQHSEAVLRQYERMVSSTLDGMAVVDRSYTYRLVNQTYLNTNRKPREEIVGHTISELLGESVFQTIIKPQFDRCLSGETVRYESWFDYGDGEQHFIDVTYAPYLEQDGTISGVVVAGRDLTDLKRAEAQLRESEERFRLIFENAAIGIAFITPPDYTLKLTNPFFQQLTGYSAAELADLNPDALTHPEDLALEEPLHQECRAGLRSHYQIEKRYIRKNGEVIWVNLIASVIFDQPNQVKYAIGLVEDITDRKVTEAALQEQESFLRSIYEGSQAGIFVVDVLADGDFRYVGLNPAHAALTGLTTEYLQGKTPEQVLLPQDAANVMVNYQRCVDTAEAIAYEEMMPFLGIDHWWFTSLTPLRNDANRIYRIIGSSINITALKQAERALRDSEEQLRSLVEDVSVGIVMFGPATEFLLSNQTALELLGRTQAELIHKTVSDPDWDVIYEDGTPFPSHLFPVRQALATRQPVQDVVMGLYRPRYGDRVWLLVNAVPQLDAAGNVRYVICSFNDITARKMAEDILQRQANQEQAYNRVVQAIRNSLDLNTIFSTATREFAELLQLDGVGIPQYLPERHCWIRVAEHIRKSGTVSCLGVEIPDINNPITERLKQREVVLVADTYTLSDPINQSLAQRGAAVGWLIVPLEVNERVWGCLVAIKSPAPASFTEDEIQLARRFADQLAIAIHQSHLYQQVQQFNRTLEQRMAERTAQLHLALSAAGMSTWEKDIATQVEQWSPETYKLLGLRTDEQGRILDEDGSEISAFPTYDLFYSFIHPADRAQFEQAHQQALQQRSSVDCEFRVVWHNGTVRWCHSRGAFIYNEQGQPIKLAGVSLDITDRKQAEAEILRTRNLFEATFEQSTDAIFLVDSTTFLTINCNQRAVELFEAECKQQLLAINGATLHRYPLGSDDRLTARQALATERYWSAEIEYVSLKGHTFWGNIAVSQIQVGHEQMQLVRITDISDRKQTEQVLAQQLQRQHLLHTISQQIRQSLHLDEILATTVTEVRRVLQTDRVVIFRLRSNRSGHVMQESVAADLPITPDVIFPYDIFPDSVYDFYCQGNVRVILNAGEDVSGECPADLMQRLGVKSKVVAPIVQHLEQSEQQPGGTSQNTLWGLLLTYTYSHYREWLPSEIDLLQQLATQVGIALQQANLYTQLENQLAQKEVLLKEVHHRVKNNLQVISSMLWLQTKTAQHPTLSRALADTRNRLQAMALIHETLYQSSNLGELNFHDYIQRLATNILSAHSRLPNQINLIYRLQPVTFNLDTAIPCGLLLNELLTNAIKHAFPNDQPGEVCITLEQQAGPIAAPAASLPNVSQIVSQLRTPQGQEPPAPSYVLTIQDNGVGMPEDLDLKHLKSLGLKIAYDLAVQLRGSLAYERQHGTRFQLTFSALKYRKRF